MSLALHLVSSMKDLVVVLILVALFGIVVLFSYYELAAR